ncbi:MAG: hypothetical protein QOF85_2442 [Solirubrobacterales bacterium]|jgi:hypothetical protein|nr:hypothetical protein [Solirubrobacterales bacterium]
MPPRASRWAGLVFALLVFATLAAFAWSQQLKRDPLVLDRVTFGTPASRWFTPNGDCRFDRERIRFRVTQSDHATVQVVKPGGKLVLTLARDQYLKRYHFFTFYWDGRSRNDGIAPLGRYKLRVKLLGQERVLVPPGLMRLHRAPRNPTKGCKRAATGSKP